MKRIALFIISIGCLPLLLRCSSESRSWTSKAYHNTTAHYNGYYYSREELKKVDDLVWGSLTDDYNRILRLYPALDSAVAKGYDKEIQEAVKMASIAIQRHPNSKWVDDNYILVGRARFYSMDWGNAIQTFKYVNTKSDDIHARHTAIIHLVRTFTEKKEYNNAQAAIDFLQKEEPIMNKANRKALYLEKAYYYQNLEDLDKMVRNLTSAVPLLKKRDRPGRVYFIIGQIYQKLGFEDEAYGFYKKCISTNPAYEVDFYARLYMAQVTEISRSRDVNAARKSFKQLLKDSKNKEFRDKIYYEMGVFELKQKNLKEGIENFNLAVRTGNNKRIDGEAYLRLGEVYYDTLRKFELSAAYYDSAINALSKDYEGYAQIKERQLILAEFVKNLKTIQWQDSLLAMASLDSVQLRGRIDSAYQIRKAAEEKKEKAKKKSNRISIEANDNNVFSTGENENENTSWYFGNSSAMSIGQNEFKRTWGDVPLEDNWRRSNRIAVATANSLPTPTETDTTAQAANQKDLPAADPVAQEYDRVNKEIPRTEEQRKVALKKIEEAYFNLGDIYYFKLQEKDNAVDSYTTLLRRFPGSDHEAEVLYKLYLIFKETDQTKADFFASRLKELYPNSTYTKILLNPNYLVESSLAVEKQKVIYKSAYEAYEQGDFTTSSKYIDEAMALGETSFKPTLDLLRILIVGETENINQYQYELDQFIQKYPMEKITEYAKSLLQTSKDFQQNQEKQKGIQYIKSLEEAHYFVMIYPSAEKLSNAGTSVLEKFNSENFARLQLKTSNLQLSDDYGLILVTDLPQVTDALEFMIKFNQKLPSITELRNHKFNTFVITKDNFDIFYRTKGLDEYLRFFEKNYPAEVQ
ncbi:type IX secretion system periplasmic lipoprotein PorW/SprE [Pseudochryseolinea flava]|uniref:type IX secretion system periplasmic lipoprotein PorW/SprE n=1 Tax=Pseudochryseolinea flava TaxID=2059302 RepID=UPI001402E21B|nr:tetratricopeptide repeat protein [Pseudochryseolinea flava]